MAEPALIRSDFGILIALAICALTILVAAGSMTIIVITRTSRRVTARNLIVNYMKDKGYTMMSFDRIRTNIKEDFSDEFLLRLPEYFPTQLRRARLKGGRPGLARIKAEALQPIEEGSPGEVAAI